MDDDRIDPERPVLHCEDRPVLYRADGTPLKRPIGFAMPQLSTTLPGPCKPTKKPGKKRR